MASKILTEPVKKAFYDMLYVDGLRGEDSTGVAAISNPFTPQVEIDLFKSVGGPSEFFYDHCKFGKAKSLTHKPVGVFIGHNRFATQGLVDVASAHPFEFPNLVGAHNGTVSQPSLRDFHGFKEFNIDSQIIFSHLSHTGSLSDVWQNADGALALVWWDKPNNVLKMIRNKQRPLCAAYTDDDKTVFWASEYWMLAVAAMRHGVKLKDNFDITPDTLYTFSAREGGCMQHTCESLPPFVAKPVVYNPGYGGNYAGRWSDDDWDDLYGVSSKPASQGPTAPDKLTEKVLVIREFNDVPNLPSAFAYLEDGALVKINIPLLRHKEAKDKIVGRGQSKGYYVAKRIYKSALRDFEYWANWSELSYVALKNEGDVVRKENNGFEINYRTALPDHAPWFLPNQFLTEGAYKNRTQCGCLNCEAIPTWGQRNDLFWVDNESFVCDSCRELPFISDMIKGAGMANKQAKEA